MKHFAEAITAIAGLLFLAYVATMMRGRLYEQPGTIVKVQYAQMTKIRALCDPEDWMIISQPGYESEDVVTMVVNDSVIDRMRAEKVPYVAMPRKGN